MADASWPTARSSTPDTGPTEMRRPRRRAAHLAAMPALALVALAAGACSDSSGAAEPGTPPEIQVNTVAVLDFTSAEVAPSFEARVFPLPAAAGWAVSAKTFGGFVQLLDSSGLPAGQLGREGSGPGEISGPIYGHPVGDEVWILDPGSARLSRFDPDGTFLGSRMLAAKVSSVDVDPLRDGLVVGGYIGAGQSLMRIGTDPADDLVGGELPPIQASLPKSGGRQWQFAATPGPDEVWTVSLSDGMLRVHDPQLEVLERIQLTFPEGLEELAWETEVPEGAFPPESSGVLAENGIVWVLTGIPDSDWQPELRPGDVAIEDWADTLIFGIDAASREVVATHRLDRVCFPAYGAILSCVDEVGQRITLLELSLG